MDDDLKEMAAFLTARLDDAERTQNSTFRNTWNRGDPCTECERPATNMILMGPDLPCAEFQPCGHAVYDPSHLDRYSEPAGDPGILADITAKRQRLTHLVDAVEAGHDSYDLAARLLPLEAVAYADHPDYQESWRP